MKLTGRRESSNVDDRRGISTTKVGGGIVGALIVGVITYFSTGGDLGSAFSSGINTLVQGGTETTTGEYQPTPLEDSLELFSKQILASTEDIWTAEFQKMGKRYNPPTLVFYKGTTQTGCGQGSATSGPFYCSADRKIYIDLDFLATMKQQLGATGDFTNAYVIAHEVAHHVQNELGILDAAHQKMAEARTETERNNWSVRIELQADFFAGVWGNKENATFGSLDSGDMQEAIDAAGKIGDDYLQKRAGYQDVQSDSFTHGTSEQRMRWFSNGLKTGDMSQGDSFNIPYSKL